MRGRAGETRCRFLFAVVLASLEGIGCGASDLWGFPGITRTEPLPTITIRVDNYAVSSKELFHAEAMAEDIFLRVGIRTVWFAAFDPEKQAVLSSHSKPSPTDYFLRVLPHDTNIASPAPKLGFAVPCSGANVGGVAYIYYARIEALAERSLAPRSEILGAVMAHEIGHLLLGPGHSLNGIMSGAWNSKDFLRIAQNLLSFTREQGKLMRASIRKSKRGVFESDRMRSKPGGISRSCAVASSLNRCSNG